jgi:uncharacterized membrane protein YccC
MTISDAQGWILLIGSVTTSLLALLAAWKASKTQTQGLALHAQGAIIESKVDIVHGQTNSRLLRIEEELRATREALALSQRSQDAAEKARVELAHEAARAREPSPTPVEPPSILIKP